MINITLDVIIFNNNSFGPCVTAHWTCAFYNALWFRYIPSHAHWTDTMHTSLILSHSEHFRNAFLVFTGGATIMAVRNAVTFKLHISFRKFHRQILRTTEPLSPQPQEIFCLPEPASRLPSSYK